MMRIFIFSIMAFMLTACGFTPLHGSTSSDVKLSDLQVALAPIRDVQEREAGYYVQQRLLDRIGARDKAKHTVTITPRVTRRRIGVTGNDVASRYDITIQVRYSLTESRTGKVLNEGRVESVSTFGAPNDSFGLIAADTNGTQQAAKELADRLILKLSTYYTQEKANAATP
ncbi:MAG: LPS assembly lipoprotein LptE [Litorimonas sp.]